MPGATSTGNGSKLHLQRSYQDLAVGICYEAYWVKHRKFPLICRTPRPAVSRRPQRWPPNAPLCGKTAASARRFSDPSEGAASTGRRRKSFLPAVARSLHGCEACAVLTPWVTSVKGRMGEGPRGNRRRGGGGCLITDKLNQGRHYGQIRSGGWGRYSSRVPIL